MSAEMPQHWVPIDLLHLSNIEKPRVRAYAEAYARKHAEQIAAELAALRAAARKVLFVEECSGVPWEMFDHWKRDREAAYAALAALLTEE